MVSTKYAICWSDHERHLVGNFKSLFQSNAFVDCTIFAEGQCVKVHRMILSAASSYFKKMFEVECGKHPIIFLKDMKIQIVMSLLDFIYSGKVQITEDQLQEFLAAAQSLQILGITDEAKSDIISQFKKTDISDSTSKEIDQALNDLLPESSDDSLKQKHDNSEADHQYCIGSDDTSSQPMLLALPKNSLTYVVLNDADGEKSEDVAVLESGSKAEKAVVRLKSSNHISSKSNKVSSPVISSKEVDKKPKKPLPIQKLDQLLLKPSRKRGPIVITRRPNFPATSPQAIKQNLSVSLDNRQAFIVGNEVLAAPPQVLRRKDWLSVPKPASVEEKVYPCPHCHKLFGKPSILSDHLRTHTGEQPYKCELCGRKFNQISNFRRHQRSHWEERIRPKRDPINNVETVMTSSP